MEPSKVIWDHVIPGLRSACLVEGSSETGLPLTVLAGCANGEAQLWGENALAPVNRTSVVNKEERMAYAGVQATCCVSERGAAPTVGFGDDSGAVFVLGLCGDGFLLDSRRPKKIHQAAVTSVSINRWQKQQIVSCAEDGSACVTDFNEDKLVRSFKTDGATLNAISFVEKDKVVSGGTNPENTVLLWDMREPKPVISLRRTSVSCLASHPTLPYQLVVGDLDGSIGCYDLRGPALVLSVSNHTGSVNSVAFHPYHTEMVLSGGDDGFVRMFDASNPRPGAMTLHSFGMVSCVKVDACADDLTEPLLLAVSEDECAVVKHV